METDIILEGFGKCEEQHGIQYIEFIGYFQGVIAKSTRYHARLTHEVAMYS